MNKKYILDTNIITYLYQKNSLFHSFTTEKLMDISHDDKVYISILSIYEYEYGVSFADDMILEELKKAKNTFLELFQGDGWKLTFETHLSPKEVSYEENHFDAS